MGHHCGEAIELLHGQLVLIEEETQAQKQDRAHPHHMDRLQAAAPGGRHRRSVEQGVLGPEAEQVGPQEDGKPVHGRARFIQQQA